MARVSTSIKIDHDLWKEFKKHCIDHDTEVSTLLERLVREDLGQQAHAKTTDKRDSHPARTAANKDRVEKNGADDVDYEEYFRSMLRR